MKVTLYGFQYSVYTRIVRIALLLKKLDFEYVEVDPFTSKETDSYFQKQPFKKVPVLNVDGFEIYETSAITRYIDSIVPDPTLLSKNRETNARIDQLISIVDSYAYWPMVRQMFANAVYAPLAGEEVSHEEIITGCQQSDCCLKAIDGLIQPSPFLFGKELTLADIHLAPMVDYFQMSTEGHNILKNHQSVYNWWQQIRLQSFMKRTQPDLSMLTNAD